MRKEYYVYALIDPRNGEYFYIGKGKGKRYNSHLKENDRSTDNFPKYQRIKEIESENLEVKIEILFPYLSEKDAYELEKIIIYKIGRKAFREGSLLNYAQGGVWSPGDNPFYESKVNIDFDLSLLDFVAQEKFHSIKKTSNIIHLDEIQPNYLIYKYDLNGVLISIDSIKCFCKNEREINLFFEINNEDLPIYSAHYVYSKKPINNFYFSNKLLEIGFNYQYLYDPLFIVEVEKGLVQKKNFTVELKHSGVSRVILNLENKILNIKIFYPNSKTHKSYSIKENSAYGKWYEYHENGNLKNIKEFDSKGDIILREDYSQEGILKIKSEEIWNETVGKISKHSHYFNNGSLYFFEEHRYNSRLILRNVYYKNGQLKYSFNNFKDNIEYSFYSENGQLIERYINNEGFVKYNLNGEIVNIALKNHMNIRDPRNILVIHKTKTVMDEIAIEQKKQADEDWNTYNKYLNNNNDLFS